MVATSLAPTALATLPQDWAMALRVANRARPKAALRAGESRTAAGMSRNSDRADRPATATARSVPGLAVMTPTAPYLARAQLGSSPKDSAATPSHAGRAAIGMGGLSTNLAARIASVVAASCGRIAVK